MFKKYIEISNNYLIIKKSRIPWANIVGYRDFSNELLRQISPRFPAIQIYLNNGSSFFLTSPIRAQLTENVEVDSSYNVEESPILFLKDALDCKASNIKSELGSWIEWRILLPCLLGELLCTAYAFYANYSFTEVVNYSLAIGVSLLPLGWLWEKSARKKKWS